MHLQVIFHFVDVLKFKDGREVAIYSENKGEIMKLIKDQIRHLNQEEEIFQEKEVIRMTKPINIEELFENLITYRLIGKSQISEQVRMAEQTLKQKIKQCLEK